MNEERLRGGRWWVQTWVRGQGSGFATPHGRRRPAPDNSQQPPPNTFSISTRSIALKKRVSKPQRPLGAVPVAVLGRRPQPGLRPRGCSSDLPGRPGSWSSPAVGFPQGTAFPEEVLRELGLDGRVWGQMWKECILLSWALTGRRQISPRILEEKQKVQENNKCDRNTSLPPLKDVFLIGAKCLSQRQIKNSIHFQHLLKTDFKT